MPILLDTSTPEFESEFRQFLARSRETAQAVDDTVAGIIRRVRRDGDAALIELTAQFDGLRLTPDTLAFSAADIDAAAKQVSESRRAALETARDRIEAFHRRQLPENVSWTDDAGAMIGWRWTAVSRAGLYVPGGLAAYPSSVLMNAIPARVAGVDDRIMTGPVPNGDANPMVLLAARLCGIATVYRVGGAQAIAALAYGTETIRPVDMIAGPGNAYVAAAKRQIFGTVGIDMLAGPSEILIIADSANDPELIAIDLLSQAEHDEGARAVLVTDDASLAGKVLAAIDPWLKRLGRRRIADRSWRRHGAVIQVRNLDEAVEISDRIAPEHLSLMVAEPDSLVERVSNAGAVFLGPWTPEAVGDYAAGPNHVLPTSANARFSSGLSVLNFMKRTTLTRMTPGALARVGPVAVTLAESESLEAHGLSVQARLDRLNAAPRD